MMFSIMMITYPGYIYMYIYIYTFITSIHVLLKIFYVDYCTLLLLIVERTLLLHSASLSA